MTYDTSYYYQRTTNECSERNHQKYRFTLYKYLNKIFSHPFQRFDLHTYVRVINYYLLLQNHKIDSKCGLINISLQFFSYS